MITATRIQVEGLRDRYNSALEPGENPVTITDMCDAQRIIIVECPHPIVCGNCSNMMCGELA